MSVVNWETMSATDKCRFIKSNKLNNVEDRGLHWLEIAGLQITHKHENKSGANEEAAAILREWEIIAHSEMH